MTWYDMDHQQLAQTLVESFHALADEVQGLIDRKTILEHKLRFAHEQYQYLADKYAPAAPDISETLAKLQLPPDIHHPSLINTPHVPLPSRRQSDSAQAELAVFIREGRKVAHQLSALANASRGSGSTGETFSTNMTSMSTVLEQDFTVEGKKGHLGCPFSRPAPNGDADAQPNGDSDAQDATPDHSGDPICAAMVEESASGEATASGAAKCPIRFLDKHSPEEIANYVEKHKHQIPRSHEVCVRRYQRNEEQIRKLDAKYGNLATMIQDLSHLHAPMLPSAEAEAGADVEKVSNERVENWAQEVSANSTDDPEKMDPVPQSEDSDLDRQSHFDRPLKEVRVGESPSRPWGISVPIYDRVSGFDVQDERPVSPPPAPVQMPGPEQTPKAAPARKCPFDHTKLTPLNGMKAPHLPHLEPDPSPRQIPEDHVMNQPATPPKQQVPPYSPPPPQPTFINAADMSKTTGGGASQIVFNGPVFIGYPMEQAIQFMQQFQNPR